MFTCPWCGTHYQAFQSNCTNCGGPIPEVHQHIETPQGERIPNPPPPPRLISDGYAWRLLLSDGWSVAAFIFGLIGGIFVMVGVPLTIGIITAFVGIPFALLGFAFLGGGIAILVWRYGETQKVVNVLRLGLATRGQILELEENYAVSVNERHPWNITYEFEVNGRLYDSKITTLNPPGHLQAGQAACVLYLPDDPSISTIYPRL